MFRLALAPAENPTFPWFSHLGANIAQDITTPPVSLIRAVLRSGYRDQLPPNQWALQEYISLEEPNEFGDSVLAQIRYGHTYVTCWGGQLTSDGRVKWTCYAD